MVVQNDLAPGSPTTIPTNIPGSKEWSDSGLERNFSKSFDNASFDNSNKIDIELDEAVHMALGASSSDDSTAQSKDSGVFVYMDGEDGEISVYSDAKTETSLKSAVQLRLERRKKSKPLTSEEFQQKLDAADNRRKTSISFIVQRASQRFQEAKMTAQRLESNKSSSSESILLKLEKKMALATERKEKHLQSIASRYQGKMEKASSTRSLHANDAKEVQQKLDNKLTLAAERKEQLIKGITSKLREKNEKISNSRSQSEIDAIETKEKVERKQHLAAERKQQHLESITNKLHLKIERVSNTRNTLDQQQDADAKAIEEKLSQKMELATTKKENLRLQMSEKMKSKMDKISDVKKSSEMKLTALGQKFAEKMIQANAQNSISFNEERQKRLEQFKKSNDAQLETKKVELETKLLLAAERRQDHVDAKSSKAAAYLATTLQRGLEALKKKEESSVIGEESFMHGDLPLTSINESDELSLSYQDVEEVSVAVSTATSASNKSKIQIRLENWKKPTASKIVLDGKLNDAINRRKLSILEIQERANFGTKSRKTSEHVQSTHLVLKNMEEKYTQKMISAAQRKEGIITQTVEKAGESTKKFEDKKNTDDYNKTITMQQKLESKLVAAIERKENIVAARAMKAAGKVSLSVERGKSAMKQKDITVERMKAHSQTKLDSAKNRRKLLRKLEKEKRQVSMMRRVMSQKIQDDDDVSVSSLQQKLEIKLRSANERKKNIIASKASRAAKYVSSTSERGHEVLKQRETTDLKLKNENELKLKSVATRKAILEEAEKKKKEKRQKRREHAIEFVKQKRIEEELIMQWDSQSVDTYGDLQSVDTYDTKKTAARNLLAQEIQLANQVKKNELFKITEERKEVERRENARKGLNRPSSIYRGMSTATYGSIDTNDLCSFDEEDISISGLSTVRKTESKNRKAQAALALAELEIKLSEIQIMQAILLAEEASLNGQSEFKTSDKRISDLSNVKVNIGLTEDENRVNKVKRHAQKFFINTLKSAKEAQLRASKTVKELKNNGLSKGRNEVFRSP